MCISLQKELPSSVSPLLYPNLWGDIQGTDKMGKGLGLEVLRQLIISISSKILVAQ